MINVEVIKARAKLMRMPLSELAEKIGYSEAGMHAAFKHEKINYRAVNSISKVLGLALEEFVTDQEMLEILAPLNNNSNGRNIMRESIDQTILIEAHLERIKALNQGLNAYREQMEIKDRQIKVKDEQIMIFLKALNDKDEIIKHKDEIIEKLYNKK
jgi:hypothetical protein